MEIDSESNILADAPEQYLEQYAYLSKCKEEGDKEKLLKAREEFSFNFPLLPSIWLDWIEDEIAKNSEDLSAIEKLFERALNDFQSVEVCLRYISWVVSVGIEFTIQKLELITHVIGLHPIRSSVLWDTYLDALSLLYETIDDSDVDAKLNAKQKIINILERTLKIPQSNIEELYQRYILLVGEANVSVPIRNAYELALKIYLEEIKHFEEDLADAKEKSEVYNRYIAYEIDGDSLSRIQYLFERAIVDLPFSENLWLQYTTWLDSRKIYSISAYDRACKLCYGCVALWQQLLLALERNQIEYEKLSSAWENAKTAIQTEDECVAVYRTYIYLTHRYLIKKEAQNFQPIVDLFKEGLGIICEVFGGYENISIQFRKNFAYYLYAKANQIKEARSMWKEILSVSGDANKAALWKESIDMERRFGNVENTRRLFYIAINSVTDNPHEIFSAFIQFEREEGTLEELDKALEKVNYQARRAQKNQTQQQKKISKRGQQKFDENEKLSKKKKFFNKTENVSEDNNDDGFKKPFLPLRYAANDANKLINKSVENMDHDGIEDNSDTPTSSGFQYSTGIELNKLFVRNVDFTCTESQLKKFFEKYGKVISVRIVTHKDGKPKGVAYIEYTTNEEAKNGLQADNMKLNKRKLKVFISNPPPKGEKRNDFIERSANKPAQNQSSKTENSMRFGRAMRLEMIPRSLSKNTVIVPPKMDANNH